jgi:molybdenum cofactor cytidylyltransferase
MIAGLLLCGGRDAASASTSSWRAMSRSSRARREEPHGRRGNALAVIPLKRARLREVLEAEVAPILESERTGAGWGRVSRARSRRARRPRAGSWPRATCRWWRPDDRVHPPRARARRAHGRALRSFAGRRGHPVGFSHALRAELLRSTATSARATCSRATPAMVERIVTDDDGIFVDIDTRADLEGLDAR